MLPENQEAPDWQCCVQMTVPEPPARSRMRHQDLRNVAREVPGQILKGWVQADVCSLDARQFRALFHAVAASTSSVATLLLVLRPRSSEVELFGVASKQPDKPPVSFKSKLFEAQNAAMQAVIAGDDTAANLLSQLVQALAAPDCPISRLELGLASCCHSLANFGSGLQGLRHLTHLSFRGSLMGETSLQLLKDGLAKNESITELDLTGCNLTDLSATFVGAILKARASRDEVIKFSHTLRQYPDSRFHRARTADAEAKAVSMASTGSLTHLWLDQNQLTDVGARTLFAAVAVYEPLVVLSLRDNCLTSALHTAATALVAEHSALQCIDLRENGKRLETVTKPVAAQPSNYSARGVSAEPAQHQQGKVPGALLPLTSQLRVLTPRPIQTASAPSPTVAAVAVPAAAGSKLHESRAQSGSQLGSDAFQERHAQRASGVASMRQGATVQSAARMQLACDLQKLAHIVFSGESAIDAAQLKGLTQALLLEQRGLPESWPNTGAASACAPSAPANKSRPKRRTQRKNSLKGAMKAAGTGKGQAAHDCTGGGQVDCRTETVRRGKRMKKPCRQASSGSASAVGSLLSNTLRSKHPLLLDLAQMLERLDALVTGVETRR